MDKSFLRGILVLALVSAMLLLSDLGNRNKKDAPIRPAGDFHPAEVKFKLGLVHYVDSPNSEECERGIRDAIKDRHLREGVDFTLKVYNAEGDVSTLNSIAGALGNESWDLVFAISTTTTQLLAKKLSPTKIVFTNVGDPVLAGLGKSMEDHMPNICGISTMSDFDGLMKLVHYLHPGMKRAGTVFTPSEVNSVSFKDHLAEACSKQGIQLVAMPANTATEVLDAANSLVAQRVDVFCQISDNLTGSSCSAILKVSRDRKVPYYGFVTQQLKQGALAVSGRDYYQAGYEAGQMGIRVLSGTAPAQIAYRVVSKTDYLIDLEIARFYNVRVPDRVFKEFPRLQIVKQ
jgi:ABC-type uncharacterized transport system substrate-binding protein